jgi:4'-phosphopantetheinyl transferase EntD
VRSALAPDASGLFPRGVLVVSCPVFDALHTLHASERALVSRAVPKRQHEFATGRSLAHELLARLGAGQSPLLADADRAPLWPAGIIGSISHARGLCVVAVSRRGAMASLGVDVEDAEAVRPELWQRVLRPDEERWLRAQPGATQLRLAAVFFSAKEAVSGAVPAHARAWASRTSRSSSIRGAPRSARGLPDSLARSRVRTRCAPRGC